MHVDEFHSGLWCKSEIFHKSRPLSSPDSFCQIGCLMSAANAGGCPNVLDLKCQCSKSSQIRSLAEPCVKSKCGDETGSILNSVADAICTECV